MAIDQFGNFVPDVGIPGGFAGQGQIPTQVSPPQFGLSASEDAQRRGLSGALQGLEGGFGQSRQDLLSAIGQIGGTGGAVNVGGGGFSPAAAGAQGFGSIRGAIDQGVEGLQGFIDPGQQAFQQQAALSGVFGADAQAAARQPLTQGQEFLRSQGEQANLRNASSIGGVGGGNIRAELNRRGIGQAQQFEQQQFQNLAQTSGQGLQAAGQAGALRGQQAGFESGIIGQQIGAAAQLGSAQIGASSSIERQRLASLAALQGQLGGLGAQSGLSAADLAFQTGQSLSQGRTRAGQDIAGAIGGTTSSLADLVNRQGAGASDILGGSSVNLANLLQGFGQGQAGSDEALAQLLSNLSVQQGTVNAARPSAASHLTPTGGILGDLANVASGAGTAALGAAALSDRRLKKNIVKIGSLANGLNLYRWDWKDIAKNIDGIKTNIGVMADEVAKIMPRAVILDKSGYYKVNYAEVLNA